MMENDIRWTCSKNCREEEWKHEEWVGKRGGRRQSAVQTAVTSTVQKCKWKENVNELSKKGKTR
jgi:hypothetical protein